MKNNYKYGNITRHLRNSNCVTKLLLNMGENHSVHLFWAIELPQRYTSEIVYLVLD